MFCFICGREIPDDSVFCPECGARVDLVEAPAPEPPTQTAPAYEAPQPPEASAPTYPGWQAQQGETTPPGPAGYGTSRPRRKRRVALIVIPIVAVLLVAGVVAGGLLTNWFGLAGGSAGVPVRDSLNDYSWQELSQISEAISAAPSDDEGLAIAAEYHLCNEDGTLDGSQTKAVELSNGVSSSVRIIGFRHDDRTDGSGKAGITLAFTEAVDYAPMSTRGSNEGGWKYSDLRARLNSDFLESLPQELGDVVVEVDKPTNNVGAAYDKKAKGFDTSCVSVTPDKVWLPSYTETVGELEGEVHDADPEGLREILNGEGSQYQYFAELGLEQGGFNDALVLEDAEGVDGSQAQTEDVFWERSPSPVDARYAYTVSAGGESCNEGHTVAYTYGVAPCFCV